MQHDFDNLHQAQAQIKSLPKAELRTLHKGTQVEKNCSPSEFEDKLSELDVEDAAISRSPESDAVAVVNKESQEVATTGSSYYDLVTHEEAFNPMMEALQQMNKSISGSINTYHNGNTAVLRVFFDEAEFNVSNDSRYREGFQVWNTYNKSSSVTARGYFERVVCSNGMFVTGNLGLPELRRQHRGDVDIVEEYKQWIKKLMNFSEKFKELIQDAREEYAKLNEVALMLSKVGFPKKHMEEIEEMINHRIEEGEIEEPLSKKDVYDAATNYVTHEIQGNYAQSTFENYSKKAEMLLSKDVSNLTTPQTEEQQELIEVEQ